MPVKYMQLLTRYRALIVSLVVTLACWAAYYAWYLAGFPGHAIHVFCEVDSGGLFKQDGNTLSSFLFVYFGHLIAWRVGRQKAEGCPPLPDNLMNRTDLFSGGYALVVILLGWGTVAMHGSLTSFGGFLDVSSMYIWVSFCLCYSFIRVIRRGVFLFVLVYAGLNIILMNASLPVEETFGALITAAVILECIYRLINRKQVAFENKWILYTAISFFSGFGIWNLSLDGRPLYYPDTIIQGHAAWHILCAVATWTIYRYYRSEKPLVLS